MNMMESAFDLNVIWSSVSVLAQLAIFAICLYYVIVKPGIDSIFLVIGSFIHFITGLFYSVLIPILTRTMGTDIYSNRVIFNIFGFIGMIGTICFTVGIILLVVDRANIHKQNKSRF